MDAGSAAAERAEPVVSRSLTTEQRTALARKLAARRERSAQSIPRRSSTGPAPTSHNQELLWLLDQVAEGGWAYNAPETVRITGPLDVDALRKALDAVVARNEILRTTYELDDHAIPVQVIHTPAPVALHLVDLGAIADHDERLAAADARLQAEAERPFDLSRDPSLRALLVRLADDDHLLLLVVHHIAIDGSSRAPLWRQISDFYNQAATGAETIVYDEPALQYADYAAWQRERLATTIERDLEYWRTALTGAPALLDLPTDRPRPAVQRFHGAHHHQMLSGEMQRDLKQLAGSEGATLFMAALAGLATLLHRYSGQDDIVIGTPIANRNHVDLADVIGYFANTLALRTRFDGDPTFREVLRQVRSTVIEGFRHQEVPFGRVVNEVAPDRDAARTPLFQVLLVVHTEEGATRELEGLKVERHVHERAWSKFDLTVGMGEHVEGLGCGFEYSTDLWDRDSIERMQQHFATLLCAALAQPDVPVSQLPLMNAAETELVLRTWNGPRRALEPVLLNELFERAAERTPDAVAIDSATETITYAELDRRANALALALAARGVGVGDRVGVCIGQDPALVVALLGVLKAGATCLPLDPEYPSDRLALMVADSGAACVVTTGTHRGAVPSGAHDVLVLDAAFFATTTAEIGQRPARVADADDIAYLIYTSGSTGTPKGVRLTHRGLVNHTLAAIDLYGIVARDRVLQMCSPSFDISIEEIFPTLAAGATLVTRDASLPAGGAALVEWLTASGITVLDVPTAFWHEWVRDLADGRLAPPSSLRALIVGGEKASAATYAVWRGIAPSALRWFNTYGPTETSIIATAFEPAAEGFEPDGARELPIGRPITNCSVYVLDAHARPVPVGVRGELHIGGVGVALGYHGDPARTAERFVEDPFTNDASATVFPLYRTGDVVRWRSDGTIEFVGRVDHQVKIRGFRVEPAEVEAAFAAHPAVSEVVVVARDGAHGKHLVAYTTLHDGHAVEGRELRRFVAATLPAYMAPSSVVVVPALPRTPNGKVDHAALPDDEEAVPVSRRAPRDDVERRLADLWSAVLGIDEISIDDSFFDLGGHSLVAVRLFGLIERAFDRRLPLAALIQNQTVAELAELLRDERPVEWRQVIPLQEGGHDVPLFFVHGPMGEGIIYLELVRHLGTEHPAYAFQDRGLDATQPQFASIEAMAAAYIDEMQNRQPHGPYVLGGFCMGGVVAYEMAHQLELRGEDVALVLLIDAAPLGHLAGGRAYTTSGRIKTHVREFATLRGPQRWSFAWETTANVFDRIMRPYWWRFVRRQYLERNKPLPKLLYDVESVNWMIGSQYVAPPYHGRVVLLRKLPDEERPSDRYRREQWARLVAEGAFRVVDIESPAVSHMTMLTEPHVRLLADAARAVIDEALKVARTPLP